MDDLFKELELQLRTAPLNVLDEGLFYLNTLIQRDAPEAPFTSMDELVIYRQMLWRELHRRKFTPCMEQLQQHVPALNAFNETPVPTMRLVTITIVDPSSDDDDDDSVIDLFKITDDTQESPKQPSNTESSTISLSISESEIPKPKIDIVEKWLLYNKYGNDLAKISAHNLLNRFNRTRKALVEDWLKNFDEFEQELPSSPPPLKRSNSCMF